MIMEYLQLDFSRKCRVSGRFTSTHYTYTYSPFLKWPITEKMLGMKDDYKTETKKKNGYLGLEQRACSRKRRKYRIWFRKMDCTLYSWSESGADCAEWPLKRIASYREIYIFDSRLRPLRFNDLSLRITWNFIRGRHFAKMETTRVCSYRFAAFNGFREYT